MSKSVHIAGGNNITLSTSTAASATSFTISGPNTHPQQTAISGIIGSDATYTSGTVQFTGSNMVTVKSSAGQRIVIDATQTVQTQNLVDLTLSGNTSGALALISSGTATLAGGNNITLSQAGNAITISGPNVAGAQTGISGLANSETTYTSGSVTLSGLANITIRSTTGQHFQFSVHAPETPLSVGVSTGGNTQGNTTVNTGSRLVFVGSDNITLSQATGAGATTISISGASAAAGGGATMSRWPIPGADASTRNSILNAGTSGGTGGSTQWTMSGRLMPVQLLQPVNYSVLQHDVEYATPVAGTGSNTYGHAYGLYTKTGNTYSLVSDYYGITQISQNSVTAVSFQWNWGTATNANSSSSGGNLSASFTGQKVGILYNTSASLPAGQYFIAHIHTGRSAGAGNRWSVNSMGFFGIPGIGLSQIQLYTSLFGSDTINSLVVEPVGLFSTTTNMANVWGPVMPGSIHTSALTNTGGTTQVITPHIVMFSA